MVDSFSASSSASLKYEWKHIAGSNETKSAIAVSSFSPSVASVEGRRRIRERLTWNLESGAAQEIPELGSACDEAEQRSAKPDALLAPGFLDHEPSAFRREPREP